jgi:hypothetical protein
MMLDPAAILAAPISQNALQLDVMRFVEGHDTVVEHIRCHQSVFLCIQLRKRHTRIRIDERLSVK